MTRRDLLHDIGITLVTEKLLSSATASQIDALPGTQPLAWEGDLSEKMMDGAHQYVQRKIIESIKERQKYWKRDLSSRQPTKSQSKLTAAQGYRI